MKYVLMVCVVAMLSCSEAQEDKLGSKEMTLCDCHEVQLKAAKEFQAVKDDRDAIQEIQKKYKADQESCAEIVAKMSKDMKDLSDEEKKKKEQAHRESCPAFAELMDMKKR